MRIFGEIFVMNRILLPIAFLLLIIGVVACGPSANKKLVVNIGGPCESCPSSRLDTLLSNMEAYVSHAYNAKTGELTIDIDTTITPAKSFLTQLNDYGYEIDSKEFGILTTTEKAIDSCCSDDITPDLDDDESALMDEVENEVDDLGEGLEEELDNLDLEDGGGKGGKTTSKIEELVDEEDLNLDDNEEVTDKSTFKADKPKKK